MNKYYTPEIEELHVGFEYEKLIDDWDLLYTWENYVIGDHNDLEFVLNKLKNSNEDCIRVKYLDQEDIKLLGFKCITGMFSNVYTHKDSNNMEYYLWYTNKTISINVNFPNTDFTKGDQIFRGTIKNKGELKRLLKQLNIL